MNTTAGTAGRDALPLARVLSAPLVRAATVPALAACAYFVLLLALWAPYGPENGMPYETSLVYVPETTSFFDGYEYSDELRRWTQFFYTVGYRVSDVIGEDGSFLGLQLVYAALWWARGFLVFLIVRRLLPASPLVAFAAGALVLVHASDHALNWVGQLNQFGVIFWMLLSIYLLVVGLQQRVPLRALTAVGAAAFCAYMSLWSYESPLFIFLAVPVLLVAFLGVSRARLELAGAYLLVPLYYVLKNARRYLGSDGATYQESVLRDDRSPGVLLSDLWFNLDASLRFWEWGRGLPPVTGGDGTFFAVVGAATFGLAIVALARLTRDVRPPRIRPLLFLAAGAAVVLLASFPAYLVLTSARQLWRTQFLAGVGTGVLFAAVLGLVALRARPALLRPIAVAVAGAVIVFFGIKASYQAASFHYGIWDRHRDAVAQVLEAAPRVDQGTVVVLTGVPKEADPFGDNMWFDMAIRLAYPATQVAGIYYYDDGSPSPHQNLSVSGTTWRLEPVGFPTLVAETGFENTIIVDYRRDGEGGIVNRVPPYVTTSVDAWRLYRPREELRGGPPSPLAARRYLGEDGS